MDLFDSICPALDEMSLEGEIIHISDGLAEFCAINAFMSAAMTSVMSAEESVPEDVLHGARRCSDAIRTRMQGLKAEVEHFRVRFLNAELQRSSRAES